MNTPLSADSVGWGFVDRRSSRAVVTIAAALAAFAFNAMPAGAAGRRQTATLSYTSQVPGTPTGFVGDMRFQNPDNPGLKPHTLRRMVVRAAVGGIIDTTAPPQCHASDAQLMIQGPAACPRNSQIGWGVTVSDNGAGGPFPRYTEAMITSFNNQDEVVGVGVPKQLPAFKLIVRTKIQGRTSTTDFPPFPGVPPPDPFTPFKRLYMVMNRYERNGRAYARTPPRCPRRGYWTITGEFTYVDGVEQAVKSRSPCVPGAGSSSVPPDRASFAGSKSSITVSRKRRFKFGFHAAPGLRGSAVFKSLKGARGSRRRRSTLARKSFRVPAGGKVTLRIRLSKKVFRILKLNRKIRTRVTVTLENTAGLTSRASKKITLKAPKRRR
jgi:hypothetical protein